MLAQQIAKIPDEDFDEEIKTIKEESEKNLAELTVARFSRLYKSLNKSDEPKKDKDINELVDDLADNLQSFLNSFAIVTSHWENVDEKRRSKLALKLKRLISIFEELQEDQKEKNSKKPKLLLITKEEK
jgi:VanZ family protein